jgi:hypothetical protein
MILVEVLKESKIESLNPSDFVSWKNEPATKFIWQHLQNVAEIHLSQMTSRDIICSEKGLLRLNYLRGYVDAIEDFLSISPEEEDLSNEE